MQFLKNRARFFGFLALSHSYHASQRHESDLLRPLRFCQLRECSKVDQAQHTKALCNFALYSLWCDLPDQEFAVTAWLGTVDRAGHADLTHGFLLSATNSKATIAH